MNWLTLLFISLYSGMGCAQVKGTPITYIRFDAYPSFSEMMLFVEGLENFIRGNQSTEIIIDLRFNVGGDLYIGLIMASALNGIDLIDWQHGVYVLSSRQTYLGMEKHPTPNASRT